MFEFQLPHILTVSFGTDSFFFCFFYILVILIGINLVAQTVKHLPEMWETPVESLAWEDTLEKEMATHSSSLAWKIPSMEVPLKHTGSIAC